MKPKTTPEYWKRLGISLTALAASATCALAQSSDAIIDKLVEKGLLTVKEANELREEADKNFTQAHAVKSGMPEWVSSFKLSGDVRVRYENFNSDAIVMDGVSTNGFQTRNRARFRLRFGATVSILKRACASRRAILAAGSPAAIRFPAIAPSRITAPRNLFSSTRRMAAGTR